MDSRGARPVDVLLYFTGTFDVGITAQTIRETLLFGTGARGVDICGIS